MRDVRRWRRHYNRSARSYDWKEFLWSFLLGYSDRKERLRMVRRLRLKPGAALLEVSAGTGTNLLLAAPLLATDGRIVAQDISRGMLEECRAKLQRKGIAAEYAESDAAQLPFVDAAFDAVLSFGGVTMFGDRQRAIDEMARVAKPGARIVIGDIGLPAKRRSSPFGRGILLVNARYGEDPPLDMLPDGLTDLRLTWFRGETC